VKRQLHLVFDIICDPNIIFQLLEKRVNLCLKQNIFSLKNLYDISNGSLMKLVEGCYSIIVRHIDYCKVCLKKVYGRAARNEVRRVRYASQCE
jgi:hypothetical protein